MRACSLSSLDVRSNGLIAIQVDGTTLEDFARAAHETGIVQTSFNRPLEEEEYNVVVDSLSSPERRSVRSGRMRIIPRERRTFRSGMDTITGIDFDIVEQERVRRTDPIFIFRGPTAENTAVVVREILERQVSVDIIKTGLLKGIHSTEFFTSVVDLARIRDLDPNEVYADSVKKILSGSVRAMRTTQIPTKTRMPVRPLEV